MFEMFRRDIFGPLSLWYQQKYLSLRFSFFYTLPIGARPKAKKTYLKKSSFESLMIMSLSLTSMAVVSCFSTRWKNAGFDLLTVWSTGGLTWSDVKLANRSLRLLHRAGRTPKVVMQIFLKSANRKSANSQSKNTRNVWPCLGCEKPLSDRTALLAIKPAISVTFHIEV